MDKEPIPPSTLEFWKALDSETLFSFAERLEMITSPAAITERPLVEHKLDTWFREVAEGQTPIENFTVCLDLYKSIKRLLEKSPMGLSENISLMLYKFGNRVLESPKEADDVTRTAAQMQLTLESLRDPKDWLAEYAIPDTSRERNTANAN